MMRHLVNAQYWTTPAGGNTGRLFLSSGGSVSADWISNCLLDRVLTYKNLIYVLNLQFSVFALYVLCCCFYSFRNLLRGIGTPYVVSLYSRSHCLLYFCFFSQCCWVFFFKTLFLLFYYYCI